MFCLEYESLSAITFLILLSGMSSYRPPAEAADETEAWVDYLDVTAFSTSLLIILSTRPPAPGKLASGVEEGLSIFKGQARFSSYGVEAAGVAALGGPLV